jgi:hypothetical protein
MTMKTTTHSPRTNLTLHTALVCGVTSMLSASVDRADAAPVTLTPGQVTLAVFTDTGTVRMYGYESLDPQQIPAMNLYEISSASGSLDYAAWSSLASQGTPTTPAGGWDELPFGLSDQFVAEETNNPFSSTLVGTGDVLPYLDLGPLFRTDGVQDLAFMWFDSEFNEYAGASVQYVSVPEPTGMVLIGLASVTLLCRRRNSAR